MEKLEDANNNNVKELSAQIINAGQKVFQDYVENFPAYVQQSQEFIAPYVNLSNKLINNPESIQKVQHSYLNFLQNQMELAKRIYERQLNSEKEYVPVITPEPGDKRFRAPEWDEQPYYFDFIKQNYLLVSELITEIIDAAELEKKVKDKLDFFTKQSLDAFSPSNFFVTNPEAIKLATETNGKSLMDGFRNLLTDIEKGHITRTDEKAFEIGKNLAITKGAVIFENELIQLIQYEPVTKSVAGYPLVILPPWINKYYILDLHPDKSLVEFALNKGQQVFMISWKNPGADLGYLSFDDYVIKGALKAIEIARKVTGAEKVNTLGYCLGGTLLGITLAILAVKEKTFPAADAEKKSINAATFLAAMLDFSDIGPMGAIIDEKLVAKIEEELKVQRILKGEDMAEAFNAIRANELIWNYVSNNYLKGKTPSPFNVLFWTEDNTNLPATMYTFYLREMLLENKLRIKNALTICNVPIDLSLIKVPAYIVGTIEDHIAPCKTTFITTELLTGPVEFVLGDSGHIMGAVNPPSKVNKYNFKYEGKIGEGFDVWRNTAKQGEGTWWVHWNNWLKNKSGKDVPANKILGNKDFPVIEPAPGRYVKENTKG